MTLCHLGELAFLGMVGTVVSSAKGVHRCVSSVHLTLVHQLVEVAIRQILFQCIFVTFRSPFLL